jgi:hypothetical protein
MVIEERQRIFSWKAAYHAIENLNTDVLLLTLSLIENLDL